MIFAFLDSVALHGRIRNTSIASQKKKIIRTESNRNEKYHTKKLIYCENSELGEVSQWTFLIGICTHPIFLYKLRSIEAKQQSVVAPRNPKTKLLRLSIFIEIMFYFGEIHSHT